MRLLILSILLTACATTPEPNPVPSAPSDELTKVGEKIDRSEQLAAAAVTVAVEQASKPEVVKAEGKVALAYLVSPTEGDVALARARAAAASPEAYSKQLVEAKQLQDKIETMWKQAEADAKKSQADIQALKNRNTELLSEVERIKKEAASNVWTITGAFLVVAGGLACAFASVRIGIPIIATGVLAGAVPFIIESEWFGWIVSGTLIAAASLAIYWFYDKVRDSVNSSNGNDKQP
jgi:hypothetical protein